MGAQSVLDVRNGVGERDVVTSRDDDERSGLPRMEKLNLLHRKVVASCFLRQTPAQLSRRQIGEALRGIFPPSARDLGDPLRTSQACIAYSSHIRDDPLVAQRRHAAVENRTTAATAEHQRRRRDDRSPNPKKPHLAIHPCPLIRRRQRSYHVRVQGSFPNTGPGDVAVTRATVFPPHSSGSASRRVCVSSQRWPPMSSTTPERSPYSHVVRASTTRAPCSQARVNAESTSGTRSLIRCAVRSPSGAERCPPTSTTTMAPSTPTRI